MEFFAACRDRSHHRGAAAGNCWQIGAATKILATAANFSVAWYAVSVRPWPRGSTSTWHVSRKVDAAIEMSAKAMGTVLLADASEDQRHMYAEYLRFKGYVLIECFSGVDAVARAPEADIVITAVRVRGPLDGVDVARRLRAGERAARTPIIVLAGWHGEEQRAHAAGCDRFLLTLCLPDMLAREVQQAIAAQQKRAD